MDRITRLRISNVRAIEHLDLEISPFTVLIGENGSGKSTIVEALELLRKAAEPTFFAQFYAVHRGLPGLLRKGKSVMTLGVVVEDDAGELPRLEYEFSLAGQEGGAVVHGERLLVGASVALRRSGARGEVSDGTDRLVPLSPEMLAPDRLVIASFGVQPPRVPLGRLLAVLRGIEAHLNFDTVAAWAARSYQFSLSMRGSVTLQPVERLNLLGFNLANAWSSLKNVDSTHWEHTMALVRLGLGEAIDSVNIVADAAGGNVALAIKRVDMAESIPAANLSDGQLSWLAFVALAQLNSKRSLLAIDEPELHLHPSLLGRVISMLAALKGAPVIVSTHSDRVLEMLEDPVSAVRVCTLGPGGAVSISQIDAEELPRWLAEFGDLAQIRASGYLDRVLVPVPATRAEGGA